MELNVEEEDQEKIYKVCSKCKISKELTEFYKHKKEKYGVSYKCKKCTGVNYIINSQIYKTRSANWYQNNKEQHNNNHKKRRQNNPSAQLAKLARDRLYKAMSHKFAKNKPTQQVIGLSWDEYVIWIESHFQSGMNWDNRGKGINKWNVDHSIPLEWAETEDEIYKLNHYTNLKPMWSKDNESKRNFYGEIWDGQNWNKITKEEYLKLN